MVYRYNGYRIIFEDGYYTVSKNMSDPGTDFVTEGEAKAYVDKKNENFIKRLWHPYSHEWPHEPLDV